MIDNGDVLREIFEHLDPYVDPFGEHLPRGWPLTEYTIERRRALARAAYVSRTMSQYALDVLWQRLTTLVDLLGVLPSLCVHHRYKGAPEHGGWVGDLLKT